jgi:hypothetical protein
MTSSGEKPDPLKSEQVREVVLEALNRGFFREHFSDHALFDHPERNIDLNDMLFGLKRPWNDCEVDEFDADEWKWKYKITTEDIDGRPFCLVVRIDPQNRKFKVITRYPDD